MAVMVTDGSERVIVFATEQADWATTLHTNLTNAGFNLRIFTSCKDIETSVLDDALDAIVAIHSTESVAFFQKVREQRQDKHLLVFIVDSLSNVDNTAFDIAHIVLVNTMPYLQYQLINLLQSHRHLATSMAERDDLKAKIEALEKEIASQKQVSTEAELLKNAIIHNVSHELRTPLLHVKSAVTMLGESTKELPLERKVFEYAEEATARLEYLVKNITMLGSSLEYNPSPIILRDALEFARRNLGRIWQRKGDIERLNSQIDNLIPPVLADKQGLSTALQLLLDNALKFSEKEVTISAKVVEKHVVITIQDLGIGIAQEQKDNILKPFYQVDSSSTRKYGGAGVGLAIVKIILDHHHSDLLVSSELGKGTTFSFRLPVIDLSAK